jgi:two-component system LytT family response regulator
VKALLVDDEPLARRELRRLLAAHASIEIVGEAANIVEAEAQIAALSPDLVFLDIQMPGGDGFDLLARLERAPQVIFTTAFDHHAVRAFEVNALDYLLKPIEPERLAMALTKLRAKTPDTPDTSDTPDAQLEQLFVRDGDRCWFVPLREVRLISSEGNYARLHWNDAQPLLLRSLASLEPRLDERRFFRANRQQLINLDFVAAVELGVGGRLHVQLRGGPEVEISRRQARVFKSRMGG